MECRDYTPASQMASDRQTGVFGQDDYSAVARRHPAYAAMILGVSELDDFTHLHCCSS
jgi:hypothetical protein